MRPPIFFTFLGVFWGYGLLREGFCAFCDLVRTFFIAFGTFLGTPFSAFGVVEKHFDQIMTFMPFERILFEISGGSIYLGTTFGVGAHNK